MKYNVSFAWRAVMYTVYLFAGLAMGAALLWLLPACSNSNSQPDLTYPTALVTVRPQGDSTFFMQLDDSTVLRASNLQKPPFGATEVRALVNYSEPVSRDSLWYVHVNWIDSIRTKLPVPTAGSKNDSLYGNDPIEIVRDWVTVAEDGYLTLRLRTCWGGTGRKHYVHLLTGINPDNPYEVELRHNANGDSKGRVGDALVAFNLNGLASADDKGKKVKLTLRWQSSTGNKSLDFDLCMRPAAKQGYPRFVWNACVE